MRPRHLLLGLIALAAAGCAHLQFDDEKPQARPALVVDKLPARAHRVVGLITVDGSDLDLMVERLAAKGGERGVSGRTRTY